MQLVKYITVIVNERERNERERNERERERNERERV
jgi:hypothetical protein